jgi:hypothetical protein
LAFSVLVGFDRHSLRGSLLLLNALHCAAKQQEIQEKEKESREDAIRMLLSEVENCGDPGWFLMLEEALQKAGNNIYFVIYICIFTQIHNE